MIKTSQHPIFELNKEKQVRLNGFLEAYANAIKFYVNYLWNNRVEYTVKDVVRVFNLKQDQLDCPSFISTTQISYSSSLSGRALKCAATQACGMVRSAIDERKTLLFRLDKDKQANKKTRKLRKQLNHTKIRKPNLSNIYPELNSICCQFQTTDKLKADGVIILSSLGKEFGKVIIPINFNKHSRKLEDNGFYMMKSFLISQDKIFCRWEKTALLLKREGGVVGADQGINSVLTLSDKQTTPTDNHGHTLNSILTKIVKKKKGSKAFHQALDHRDNFIRWSINQLNFSGIKQVNLEKISNFRKEKNVRKFLNYFGETVIREKLLDTLQQLGVQVVEQSSAYRSQRCSQCGYVCKGNRNGKLFCCKHCSFQADADFNASCNHETNLPDAKMLLQLPGKPKEFFWKAEGFFAGDGSELAGKLSVSALHAVPNTKSNKR